MATPDGDAWVPGDPIGYITQEVPEFETHPYEGERYESMVPDTLDLEGRASTESRPITVRAPFARARETP